MTKAEVETLLHQTQVILTQTVSTISKLQAVLRGGERLTATQTEAEHMPPAGLVLELGKKYLLWDGRVKTATESGIVPSPFDLGGELYTSDGYYFCSRKADIRNVRCEVTP